MLAAMGLESWLGFKFKSLRLSNFFPIALIIFKELFLRLFLYFTCLLFCFLFRLIAFVRVLLTHQSILILDAYIKDLSIFNNELLECQKSFWQGIDVFQSHQDGGNGPGLSVAGVLVMLSIFVGYFRQARPLIALDVLDVLLQQAHHLPLAQRRSLDVHLRDQVKSVQPHPLRPVVVAESMRDLGVAGVIAVVVEGVVRRMHVGQRRYSYRLGMDEMLLCLSQVGNGMILDKEIRGNSHSNQRIWPESLLIISQRRSHQIFTLSSCGLSAKKYQQSKFFLIFSAQTEKPMTFPKPSTPSKEQQPYLFSLSKVLRQ